MNKWVTLWKESIRARYLITVFTVFISLIIVSVLFYVYVDRAQNKMQAQRAQLDTRYDLVEEMSETLTDIILRGRGFVAFNSQKEKQLLEKSLNAFRNQITHFRKMRPTKQEADFVNSLETFYHQYRDHLLPDAVSAMDQGDKPKVVQMHNDDAGELVNKALDKTEKFKRSYHKATHTIGEEMLQTSQLHAILSSGLSAVFLLLLMPLVGIIINRIVRPIEKLEHATDQISKGNLVELPVIKSQDEIGRLTAAFGKMAATIQTKEEELVTHNEELVAQQGELQEQQEKVQESLRHLKHANDELGRLNKLNHHLTFTLDKQELCNILHSFLNKQFVFDRSIFWFTREKIYASNNVSRNVIHQVVETGDQVDLLRLHEEQSYVVKRKTTAEEAGISDEPFDAYDLYASVLDVDNQVVAIFAATRLGVPFHQAEIDELKGLMQRVALAINRIYMYEDVEIAKQLNLDIVQNINEGIQLVDQDGAMLQCNDTFQQYLNFKCLKQEWTGKNKLPFADWTALFQRQCTPSGELHTYFTEAVQVEEMGDKTFRYQIDDRFMQVYAAPIYKAGNRIRTIFVHRDITREHEIDRMKSELVSTVSHELRTPLSSVLGFTELMLTKDLTDDRRKKYLETIYKEAKRLTNLINDFLDIQRMEAGKQVYHMETVRMDELLMSVLNRFSTEKNHHIYLVDETPVVEVNGDPDRLQQVVTNLISNAVKFTPDGGNIEVRLGRKEDQILVQVRDEGIGIPKQELAKLFTKFHRVDNSEQRKIGGTGLGLAISQEIIAYHEGEIWVDSEAGKGTTASFTLPLIAKQLPTERAIDFESGKQVMIVEDDTSIALLLSEELKGKGFTVIHHYSPMHAYQDAIELPLVGIVVDLMLGDEISGWELIKMLKENERTKKIPIIISSALDPEKGKAQVYQIEKYLTKPYNPEELTRALHAFLQPRQTYGDVLFPEEHKH